jgi:hypothetical protein
LDIFENLTYGVRMLKSGVSHVVHGIERFLDLMPEPLVLRALEEPGHQTARK